MHPLSCQWRQLAGSRRGQFKAGCQTLRLGHGKKGFMNVSLPPTDDTSYTVVIPSLVAEPYLFEALQSVSNQSLVPESVFVMINGNSEGIEVLRQQVATMFPTTEVVLTSAPGMISGIAEGIKLTRTPYVAFLDADDLWVPDKQRKQIAYLTGNTRLDAVYGQARNFYEDDSSSHNEELVATSARMFTTTTFRTGCFDQFGPPDVNATHHTWLYRWWHQALQKDIQVASIPEEVLLRRIHGRNSWIEHGRRGHAELLAELRQHMREKRSAPQ